MANDRARAVTFEFSTPEIALDDDGFGLHVVDFDGLEAIQRPFQFELNLASRDPEIDFARVVNGPGKLEIVRHDIAGSVYHSSVVHGLVTDFQQGGKDGDQVMYRATLRPRLWALSLTRRSRIFSNRSVPEILREVMDEHEVPHEISLKATYPAHETVVQHHETDLAFFTRLATKDGIRFAFRHDDAHDTVVLSDAPGQDPWIEGDPEVLYKSHDGLVADKSAEETVVDAFLRERTVPGKVSLQDYNYRTPSAGLDSEDDKSDGKDKRGHHQVFGQHYKDADDGKRLARVRREELHALARTISARTVCTRMRAGHRFTLAGHYRKSLDGDYLVACVRHRGGQAQDVGTGGGPSRPGGGEGADYENWIGVTPATVPYRPASAGDLSVVFLDVFVDLTIDIDVQLGDVNIKTGGGGGGGRMLGLMTATIGGGGAYAAVDGDGNYVLNPRFPESGGSTHAARQVQPYAGAGDAGFHFGTEAGNEVIYACLDGDPDRPVILGPVPNPEHPSPVASGNSSQHVIRTTKKNEIVIEDKEGEEGIRLFTPEESSTLWLGSTPDGPSFLDGIYGKTDGSMTLQSKKGTLVGTTGPLKLLAVAEAELATQKSLQITADDNIMAGAGKILKFSGSKRASMTSAGQTMVHGGSGLLLASGMTHDGAMEAGVTVNNILMGASIVCATAQLALGLRGAGAAMQSVTDIAAMTPRVSAFGRAATRALAKYGDKAGAVTGVLSPIIGIGSEVAGSDLGSAAGLDFPGTLIMSKGGIGVASQLSTTVGGLLGVSVFSGTGVDVLGTLGVAVGAGTAVELGAGLEIAMSAGMDISAKANRKIEMTTAPSSFEMTPLGIEMKTGASTIKMTAGEIEISSGPSSMTLGSTGIHLKAGGSEITMSLANMMLETVNLLLSSKAKADMKGALLNLNATAIAKLKGALTTAG